MTSVLLIPVPPDADGHRQWLCRVNGGTSFPVVGYVLEPAAEGAAAMLSLVVAADAAQIGDPVLRPVEPQRDRNEPPTSVWGNPSVPDPREDIPGWREQSLGGQVAGNAAGRLA